MPFRRYATLHGCLWSDFSDCFECLRPVQAFASILFMTFACVWGANVVCSFGNLMSVFFVLWPWFCHKDCEIETYEFRRFCTLSFAWGGYCFMIFSPLKWCWCLGIELILFFFFSMIHSCCGLFLFCLSFSFSMYAPVPLLFLLAVHITIFFLHFH